MANELVARKGLKALAASSVTGGLTVDTLTAASIAYPASDGTSGQAIVTNGSGTLTFASFLSSGDNVSVLNNDDQMTSQFQEWLNSLNIDMNNPFYNLLLGLGIVYSSKFMDKGQQIKRIKKERLKPFLETKEKVSKVLIGEPKQMNGEPSQSTEIIEHFVKKFKSKQTCLSITASVFFGSNIYEH